MYRKSCSCISACDVQWEGSKYDALMLLFEKSKNSNESQSKGQIIDGLSTREVRKTWSAGLRRRCIVRYDKTRGQDTINLRQLAHTSMRPHVTLCQTCDLMYTRVDTWCNNSSNFVYVKRCDHNKHSLCWFRCGVHRPQHRLLLQTLQPFLHLRGDGQDHTLPEHRSLPQSAGLQTNCTESHKSETAILQFRHFFWIKLSRQRSPPNRRHWGAKSSWQFPKDRGQLINTNHLRATHTQVHASKWLCVSCVR